MKTSYLILLSLLFAFLSTQTYAQERPKERAFKGIELYSWQDSNGQWLFALVPGTNQIKTEIEIKKKEHHILNTKDLERQFLRLGEGEQIFWAHRTKGFAYPDEKTMVEIESSAKKAKVVLHMPGKIAKVPDP